jgi:hypothetical protein
MPNDDTAPRRDRKWFFAAVIMGVAAGFAIAIVAQSWIGPQRFQVDCVESFNHLVASRRSDWLAIELSSGSACFWTGAYRVGNGIYRLAQSGRYAMLAKGYLARRFSA